MTFGSKKVRGTFLASCPEIKKQEKPPVEVFSLSPWNKKVREGPVTHRVRFRRLTPATMTRFEKAC